MNLFRKAENKYLISLFVLFFSWKIALIISLPNPGLDGPIYLSHAFTVMQGKLFENNFLKEYIPTFNFPYLYGFLNAVFYFLFRGSSLQAYSIFFWNLVWIMIFLYGCFRLLYQQQDGFKKFTLIALAFLINSYVYSTRSETFILPFFILLIHFLRKANGINKISYYIYIPMLLAIIGLIHPVAGVFACVFTLIYSLENKISLRIIAVIFFFCIIYVSALYIPVILIDLESWRECFLQRGFIHRAHSFTDFSVFLKYLSYNPSIACLIFIIFISSVNIYKEVVLFLIAFFTLCFFHQSYYYTYLYPFLLWRFTKISKLKTSVSLKTLTIAAYIYGVAIVFILPTYQLFENKDYASTFKSILSYLESNVDSNKQNKIWVSGEIAMPVLDKSNVRLHWSEIAGYDEANVIDTSNIFFIDKLSDLNYIKKYHFAPSTVVKIKNIIPPVPGLRTAGFKNSRSDSLGLWKLQIVAE